jgi:hypothetical protein
LYVFESFIFWLLNNNSAVHSLLSLHFSQVAIMHVNGPD